MMAHTISPEKLAGQARIMADAGCQCVYVVDSAARWCSTAWPTGVALVAELGEDAEVGFQGTKTWGWGWPTRWRRCAPGPSRSTAACAGSGPARAMRPSRLSSGCSTNRVKTGIDFFDIADAAEDVVRPAMPAECVLDRNALIMGIPASTRASSNTPFARPSATACPPTSYCTGPVSASSSAARKINSSTSPWKSNASRKVAPRSRVSILA